MPEVAGQWGMDIFGVSIRHQAGTLNMLTASPVTCEHADVHSEACTMCLTYSLIPFPW